MLAPISSALFELPPCDYDNRRNYERFAGNGRLVRFAASGWQRTVKLGVVDMSFQGIRLRVAGRRTKIGARAACGFLGVSGSRVEHVVLTGTVSRVGVSDVVVMLDPCTPSVSFALHRAMGRGPNPHHALLWGR